MSVTPGPLAMPSSTRNGRAAAVPSGKTVSRWPTSSARGPAGSPWKTASTVSPRTPSGSEWRVTSPPRRCRNAAVHVADLVDPVAGVAPAVEVDEALEVGEERRPGGRDAFAQERRARRAGRDPGTGSACPESTGESPGSARRPAFGILRAPCASSRSASWKGRTSTASSRRSRSRLPWAPRTPGTASATRRRAWRRASGRTSRRAADRRRSPAWPAGADACAWRPGRAPRTSRSTAARIPATGSSRSRGAAPTGRGPSRRQPGSWPARSASTPKVCTPIIPTSWPRRGGSRGPRPTAPR